MKELLKCQKGLTLIEVLISIVLLSIILTTFMSFFTQSAIFAQKNKQKLGSIETSEMVINTIKDNVTKDLLVKNNITDKNGIVIANLPVTNSKGVIISNPPNPTYFLKDKSTINSLLNISIATNYNVSAIVSNSTALNLIQIKVSVQDPNDANNKSETYTYIGK